MSDWRASCSNLAASSEGCRQLDTFWVCCGGIVKLIYEPCVREQPSLDCGGTAYVSCALPVLHPTVAHVALSDTHGCPFLLLQGSMGAIAHVKSGP